MIYHTLFILIISPTRPSLRLLTNMRAYIRQYVLTFTNMYVHLKKRLFLLFLIRIICFISIYLLAIFVNNILNLLQTIAERLRKKNQELISSSDRTSDKSIERMLDRSSTTTDRYSRDKENVSSTGSARSRTLVSVSHVK